MQNVHRYHFWAFYQRWKKNINMEQKSKKKQVLSLASKFADQTYRPVSE